MGYNHHGRETSDEDLRKLPEYLVEQIISLSNSEEYQHGTYCNCANEVACQKKEGEPNYNKIAEHLGITSNTVKSYLEPAYREHRNQLATNHLHSSLGEIARDEYEHSLEGRQAKLRYEKTEKGKIVRKGIIERWKSKKLVHVMSER